MVFAEDLSAATPRDWNGIVGSASRFRSGTGVTFPLFYDLPEWSRSNAIDLDIITLNPAALSMVNDNRNRFVPLSAQGFVVGKAYDVTNAITAPTESSSEILADIDADQGQVQRMHANAHMYYILKNFAYSAHYVQQRNIWLENSSENLYYQFFRDMRIQFSSGGQIFDSDIWGRLDFGTAIRGTVRYGAEKVQSRSAITETSNFNGGQFLEQGMAIGLDYSLLWSSPNYDDTAWAYQLAIVGKDIGTSKFFKAEGLFRALGVSVPFSREFPSYPNDTILGFALKLPNFRDGLRSAFRLEWSQWTRPISAANKVAVSYELRFPTLLSAYVGQRGSHTSGGLGLRFRGVELDLGTFVDLWGNNDALEARRAWIMELRGAF
ncbi:hypothetical protein GW916_00945 [bacterium]|nr:hypothetical protein [bacterium]